MDIKGYQLTDGSWSSEYKVGDKFVVSCDKHHVFVQGQVVVYIEEDFSDCPRFMDSSEVKSHCYWSRLSKYNSEESVDKFINTFKKEDLKTGMRVTIKGGASYVVFKDVATTVTDYDTILVSCNAGYWQSSGLSEFVEIIKVEVCLTPNGWAKVTNPEGWGKQTMDWKTIFEKEEISPLQKEFTELQSQIKALQEKANTIQQQINN